MPEADEANLKMKYDCAARWSLTAIKRVPDNSTPEGLLRRAGLHDFGLPRVLPEHRRLPPRPGNLARPRSRAVAVGLPDRRGHLQRHICPSLPPSGRRSGRLVPI